MGVTSCSKDDPKPEEPKKVAVTGISVSSTSLNLIEGETATLSATVSPADADNKKVEWTTSDAAIATVDAGGKVSAIKAGSASVTATTVDGKKQAVCKVEVAAKKVPMTKVTLDKTSATVVEGEAFSLTATAEPANTTESLKWSSSNEALATVNGQGKVQALKPGKVEINVCAKENDKVSARCEVTIEKKVIAVESVSLDKSELELVLGESGKLSATVKPDEATDKSITWTSSDAETVSVDNHGNLSTLKIGEATVTAKAGEKSATCKVKVIKKDVSQIVVSKSELSLEVGQSVVLTASVYPEDATFKTYSWKSSDPSVASIEQDGKVTALKAGTADVTASADGITSEPCKVTVKEVQGLSIPDPALQAYLLSIGDTNKDGKLTAEEAGMITSVRIPNTVKNLSGLEHLVNLGSFNITDGAVDLIKLSGFNKLTGVNIASSPQEVILSHLPLLSDVQLNLGGDSGCHVSNCPNINDMTVRSGTLKSLDGLDLKNLAKLKKLRLEIQEVETVALGEKPLLKELYIYSHRSGNPTEIKSLDVSGCPALTTLNVYIDYTSSLDLSKNTELRTCNIRSFKGMRSLDCATLPQDLESLEFTGHKEDFAQVSNLGHLPNLKSLSLYNPANVELDLSGNLKLEKVWISATFNEADLPLKTVYLKQNQVISSCHLPEGVSIRYKE